MFLIDIRVNKCVINQFYKILELFLAATKTNKCVIKLLRITSCIETCPDCYMTQKMCDKAVHPSTMQFVPERYKTQ